MKAVFAILLIGFIITGAGRAIETYTPPAKGITIEVDLAELAKKRTDWPAEVKLTKDCEFPVIINGKQAGTFAVPTGTSLKLIAVDGEQLRVLHKGVANKVPANTTDLVAFVSAKRLAELKDKVTIEGRDYPGVQSAKFEPPTTVVIGFQNGSNGFPVDKVPEKFLQVWGISKDDIEAAKTKFDEVQKQKAAEAQLRTLEQQYGRKPPVDPKDGSVPLVKGYFKKFLPDPASVEYLTWRGPTAEKTDLGKVWVVRVRYRGRNTLGAVTEQ